MPKGKTMIHATLDPDHLNKDIPASLGLVGDAGLMLNALLVELAELVPTPRDSATVAREIAAMRETWLAEWMPLLTSNETPLTPYRVIWDLLHTVDVANTIITHDAGSPRDQLSPFWVTREPHAYIGWGKTTPVGLWPGPGHGGEAGPSRQALHQCLGRCGHRLHRDDSETAVRGRIPILSVLFNNFSMACELHIMGTSTEKYRSTDISGDYAALARAFGAHGERVASRPRSSRRSSAASSRRARACRHCWNSSPSRRSRSPARPRRSKMARLRHFAVVVRDLEKAATFYQDVFDLKRVGQETLEFASAVYFSDGVINLALLNYNGAAVAVGSKTPRTSSAPTISASRWTTSPPRKSASRRPAGPSSSISATIPKKRISSGNSRTPTASSSIFRTKAGSARSKPEPLCFLLSLRAQANESALEDGA